MNFYFTPASRNAKTGPMPVVTSTKATCPTSCPLMGNGCYAESGPLAILWRQVSTGVRGIPFDVLLKKIRGLPRGQIWRYGQAGDLPGHGDCIDQGDLTRLAKANRGRPAIVFTHKPPTAGNLKALREAEKLGMHVNLSANGPADADRLVKTGMSVVTVLPSEYERRRDETISQYKSRTRTLPKFTPGGVRIAVCPATYTDVTCLKCGVCATKRPKGTVIGFPAHASKRRQIDHMLKQG